MVATATPSDGDEQLCEGVECAGHQAVVGPGAALVAAEDPGVDEDDLVAETALLGDDAHLWLRRPNAGLSLRRPIDLLVCHPDGLPMLRGLLGEEAAS